MTLGCCPVHEEGCWKAALDMSYPTLITIIRTISLSNARLYTHTPFHPMQLMQAKLIAIWGARGAPQLRQPSIRF
jgi:hypothetical protein